MSRPDGDERRLRRSVRTELYEALVTGTAVVVPFVVTLVVLSIVFSFVYQRLDFFSNVLLSVPGVSGLTTELVVDVLMPVLLVVTILVVGVVANRSRMGERGVDYFDSAVGAIPGIGSIYQSFRQMSDVVLESDVQNFREVKLVEFPNEGVYTLGFLTTRKPDQIRAAAPAEEMVTLFLPLAPNPVMGGHLIHVSESRVRDVDMSVEEAMSTVVTTGVGTADAGSEGLDPEQLQRLEGVDAVDPDPATVDAEEQAGEGAS